jgi:hypothetical protein
MDGTVEFLLIDRQHGVDIVELEADAAQGSFADPSTDAPVPQAIRGRRRCS